MSRHDAWPARTAPGPPRAPRGRRNRHRRADPRRGAGRPGAGQAAPAPQPGRRSPGAGASRRASPRASRRLAAITLWTRLEGSKRDRRVCARGGAGPGLPPRGAAPQGAVGARRDHTVETRVAASASSPGSEYYYRFETSERSSPVGRFRTARPADSREPVRIGFFSCQDYQAGFFGAHRRSPREDADLVVCLGDYIYERNFYEGPRKDTLGANGDGEVQTLAEYRAKYRMYKSDPDLQAMHAAHPFVGDLGRPRGGGQLRGSLPARRPSRCACRFSSAAGDGYRAFYEYMPFCRPTAEPELGATTSTGGCGWARTSSCSCSTSASTATTSRAATVLRAVPRGRGRAAAPSSARNSSSGSRRASRLGRQVEGDRQPADDHGARHCARARRSTRTRGTATAWSGASCSGYIARRRISDVASSRATSTPSSPATSAWTGAARELATEFVGGRSPRSGSRRPFRASAAPRSPRSSTMLLTNNLRTVNPHLRYPSR